jgi:hypothetical protein
MGPDGIGLKGLGTVPSRIPGCGEFGAERNGVPEVWGSTKVRWVDYKKLRDNGG